MAAFHPFASSCSSTDSTSPAALFCVSLENADIVSIVNFRSIESSFYLFVYQGPLLMVVMTTLFVLQCLVVARSSISGLLKMESPAKVIYITLYTYYVGIKESYYRTNWVIKIE